MAADLIKPTNGLYNTLCDSLNLSNQTFQMIQGVLPVQSQAQGLYNYFDGIPPKSVSVSYTGNPLNTLNGNYAIMLGDTADTSSFLYTIAFNNYMNQDNWIGRSVGSNPIYDPSFDDLKAQVNAGSTAKVSFNSETASTDISSSWAKSDSSAGVGFWGKKESSVSESLNQMAAANKITVDITLDKFAFLAVQAGGWFFSGYFADMYQNPGKFTGGQDQWDKLFGPSGSLQRVANQVLLVSGYKISIRSWATYSQDDFEKIEKSSETNVWPFYTSGSSSTATSHYTFNDDKSISVDITSQPGDLQILGMGVIPTKTAITGGSDDHNVVAASRMI